MQLKYHNDGKYRVIAARYNLIADYKVTLNGKAAIITGAMEDWATIYTLGGSPHGNNVPGEYAVTCSWTSVLSTIKNKQGQFTT